MNLTEIDGEKVDEKNFKKALLNRYLEDQVLYRRFRPKNGARSDLDENDDDDGEDQGDNDNDGGNDDDDEDDVFLRLGNDVIVKINDEESATNGPTLNRRKKVPSRNISHESDEFDESDNNLGTGLSSQAKLSRSLDERTFKSLYLDIPSSGERCGLEKIINKNGNLLKSNKPVRKYSDCSSNCSKNFTPVYSSRLSAEDASMQDKSTRMTPRRYKKISLPGPGMMAQSRMGRRPSLSLSSFDYSMMANINGFKDKEANRMSLSSFKSSCSSFVEVEFGDSDYDRSCTSSPCSPLAGQSRFPPINSDF